LAVIGVTAREMEGSTLDRIERDMVIDATSCGS
jgi:hypothetical protein